jgi:trans-aconitate methyltransferase
MPTMPWTLRRILRLFPEEVTGTIHELGSAWGGAAFALARAYPRARIVGVEQSPLPWLWSRIRSAFAALPNLEFRRGDFFQETFQETDILFCYLSPEIMTKLKQKCEKELRPGGMVISHAFAMPGWTPETTEKLPGIYPTPVYVYRIPE